MSIRTALTSVTTAAGARVETRRPIAQACHRIAEQSDIAEEALVVDARAGLTPAEVVERKLATLLKGRPLPVSHLLSACRTRRPG